MQLYDLAKNRVSDIQTIKTEDATMIASKMTEPQLNSLGYYNYITPPETKNTEYNTLVSSPMVLIDGVYTVTYVYADVPLEEAQVTKHKEINAYGWQLIYDANGNPTDGITMEPEENIKRSANRTKDRANKLAGELTLKKSEKNEAKNDQKLSEYEGKVWADANKAIANMLKLDTTAEVSAFDVSAENWNVWIAPDFGV